METPVAANQRWSLDFALDQMTDGWRFRILAVVDALYVLEAWRRDYNEERLRSSVG